jgi:hypothetical protein
MSRHIPEVSLRAWRVAVLSMVILTSAVISAALLLASQSQAINTALIAQPIDEQWQIRSGRTEADRLVLAPAANSIGTALHPIDPAPFTLQAQVDLMNPSGSGGLIVQADDADHFTAFLISRDGYFRVGDYRNGVWIDRATWRAWPHIRRDGSPNVLRAECRSDTCTFFVNDEWTWQEHAVPTTRWIGVMGDGTDARFEQVGWQP